MASAPIYCPTCGTANEPPSVFCANCGKPLPSAGSAAPYPSEGQTSRSYSSPAYPAGGVPLPPPPYPTGNTPSSPRYPAGGSPFPPPYQTGNTPSSPTYATDGSRLSPPPYPMGNMQSPPSYPAGGQLIPPPTNPMGDRQPAPPQPKPRRGKKIGIIAIIAVTLAILLVGAYLAVALLKPSPQTGTATPTANTTATAQTAAAALATAAAATATAAPVATPTTAPASSPTAQATTPVAQSGLPCTVNIPTWTDGSSDWKVLNNVLLNDGTNREWPATIMAPPSLAPANWAVQPTMPSKRKIQVINATMEDVLALASAAIPCPADGRATWRVLEVAV